MVKSNFLLLTFFLGGLLGASSGTVSNNFTISGLEGSNASDKRCGGVSAEDKSLFLSSTLGGLLFAGSIFFADEFETVDFLKTTGSGWEVFKTCFSSSKSDPEFDRFTLGLLGGRKPLDVGTDWDRFDVLLLFLLPTDSYSANLDICESHDNLLSLIGEEDRKERGDDELEGEFGLILSTIGIGAVLVARVDVRSLIDESFSKSPAAREAARGELFG